MISLSKSTTVLTVIMHHHKWSEFNLICFVFLKMGQPRPLFRLFLVFSNKHYNFYNNNM